MVRKSVNGPPTLRRVQGDGTEHGTILSSPEDIHRALGRGKKCPGCAVL